MRVFVAGELPSEVAHALFQWGRTAAAGEPALRRLPPENLHLTLAFLGEIPADDVAAVGAAVQDIADIEPWPLRLALGGPLWLSPRRPHVLCAEVHDQDGTLGRFHAALAARLRDAVGYEPEHRRFRPHITVARVRAHQELRGGNLPVLPQAAFGLERVTVMRSHLHPDGARYEPLLALADGAGE